MPAELPATSIGSRDSDGSNCCQLLRPSSEQWGGNMDRRAFVRASIAAGLPVRPTLTIAASSSDPPKRFELPPLPYPASALAMKGMSQETLELHHGKHHQAYVTALNGLVEKDPSLQGKSLEEIVKSTHNDPSKAPVFNNAGQRWNHILFWQVMSPGGGRIPGRLEKKITEDFGGVPQFKDAFKSAGNGQF